MKKTKLLFMVILGMALIFGTNCSSINSASRAYEDIYYSEGDSLGVKTTGGQQRLSELTYDLSLLLEKDKRNYEIQWLAIGDSFMLPKVSKEGIELICDKHGDFQFGLGDQNIEDLLYDTSYVTVPTGDYKIYLGKVKSKKLREIRDNIYSETKRFRAFPKIIVLFSPEGNHVILPLAKGIYSVPINDNTKILVGAEVGKEVDVYLSNKVDGLFIAKMHVKGILVK